MLLKSAIASAAELVERRAAAINALNVFPVPDGDTGTNMALTLRSAADAALACSDHRLAEVANAAAHGALMGARGNSGVILAQILRGMARALSVHRTLDSDAFARALRAGSVAAYEAVVDPVEGTMLTVARMAAAEAGHSALDGHDLLTTLTRCHEAARAAVAETPRQLPILEQAGVVDAGGEGFRTFLDGILATVRGEPVAEVLVAAQHVDFGALHDDRDTHGYCTEVLFTGANLDANGIRKRLNPLGTSLLVIGDPGIVRVHIHTDRPGSVLDLACDLGQVIQVKVENLQRQREAFRTSWQQSDAQRQRPNPGLGVVAVVVGDGFRQILSSLGAAVIVCPNTMNPSVEEVLHAIRGVQYANVVVLPNDANAALACEHAVRAWSEGNAVVLPTRTIPEGIAALLAVNPEASLETNLAAMDQAAHRCHTIALTRSSRDATIDGIPVATGDLLAIADSRLIAARESYFDLTRRSIKDLRSDELDIATVYVGAEGDRDTADSLCRILEEHLEVTVEVAEGGQPHHEYIIALE
ncbi:MAG TPA: DAK2 domain-containing protein [Chloroflexota bacterium]|nr:DAK2 domain-containing protein [Chloroflexota bacterium]